MMTCSEMFYVRIMFDLREGARIFMHVQTPLQQPDRTEKNVTRFFVTRVVSLV